MYPVRHVFQKWLTVLCPRKSCGLDDLETDFFTCDPAGVCFEDTLAAIDVKDSNSLESLILQ